MSAQGLGSPGLRETLIFPSPSLTSWEGRTGKAAVRVGFFFGGGKRGVLLKETPFWFLFCKKVELLPCFGLPFCPQANAGRCKRASLGRQIQTVRIGAHGA